jgi:hypothetical protein
LLHQAISKKGEGNICSSGIAKRGVKEYGISA